MPGGHYTVKQRKRFLFTYYWSPTRLMYMETWEVTGIVDQGAVSFPVFKKVTVRYAVPDWQTALHRAGSELATKSNHIGPPQSLLKLVRIHPPS